MFWSEVVLYKRGDQLDDGGTRTVTWNALMSVLSRTANGDMKLDQVARNCKDHFDTYMEHGKTGFRATGEARGIVWSWTRVEFARRETIELRGPLAQLDWDFIATGE